ncbi:hypothetical protein ACFXKC_56070, partial [Streptomyces sp. NPDC059340]|uniref:hypothetical protein n=1 Tax=Streptomyces sp. NPDC059340 TaxID=3346806 RepID=UPI00367F2F1A
MPLFVGAAGAAVSPSPVVCAGEEGAEEVAEGGEAASRDVEAEQLSKLVVRDVDDLLMEVGVGEQSGRSVSGGG